MKETRRGHNLRNGVATGMIVLGTAAGIATAIDNFGINTPQNLVQQADEMILHATSDEGIAAAEKQMAIVNQAVQKSLSRGEVLIDLSKNKDIKTIQKSAEILVFEREERPIRVANKINQLASEKNNRTKHFGLSFLGLIAGGMLLKIDKVIKFFKEGDAKGKAASSLPQEFHQLDLKR